MIVWWDKNEADQGIEALSIKEAIAGSLDDPKENEVCMLTVYIEESCHMVAGNMDQCSILSTWSKERISSLKGMQGCMGHTFTRRNQHNMSSYELWGGWLQLTNSDWKLLGMKCVKKGRKRLWICNLGKGNQHLKDQEDLTRISPWKIWRLW